jgi:hypothetical protein
VYRLFRRWRKNDVAEQAVGELATLMNLSKRRRHSVRVIIDASSDADRRTKSRWSLSLRFAWRERRRYRDLVHCLNENGGVAGCARLWAEARVATVMAPRFVRLGGGWAPKVPFLVDVRLLDEHGRW